MSGGAEAKGHAGKNTDNDLDQLVLSRWVLSGSSSVGALSSRA